MPDSADLIAQRLARAGCRHAFGIPGGEVLAIMDALDRAGIRVLLARHENGAGFMGEGVHHSDGAPAILVATIGPGLTNAATVIANAFQDRVPMVVLTGCVSASERHSYTHQVLDHVKLAEAVAKAAFRVEDGMAGLLADRAVAIATEGRPGPVLLDIPIDVQTREQPAPPPAPEPEAAPAPVGPAEGPALDKARTWLAEARRPLVIAGLDVPNQGAEAAVAAFCRRFRAPLITTYKAKGTLPEDDPLALGAAGLSPRVDSHLLPLVAASDCVVLAGYDPIEMRIGWRDPWGSGARVIDLPAVPGGHGMHRAPLLFPGDVAAGLAALGQAPRETWPGGEPAAARAALSAGSGLDEDWGPAAVVDVLRGALPRDAVVTTDSGAHRILLSQLYECYRPRGLLQSTGLCTMGGALPLAIGRKLAEPERAVVATMGDGGLEMVLGELATLRDTGLALPVLVFADAQLGLIELKQRSSQLPNLAVDFGATDFPAVARALGGEGVSVRDRAGLAREMEAALARDRFTIIAAEIGRRAYDGRI